LPPLKANLAPTNPFSAQAVAGGLKSSHFRRRNASTRAMPIQRPQRGRPLRSGRTKLAPYASSLVVSDIAEAELVGGSGRPGPWPQPTVKLVGGAATAQTQGYVRPDQSQMDAGCAWWMFAATMLTEHPCS
jgi:hypothetical protein